MKALKVLVSLVVLLSFFFIHCTKEDAETGHLSVKLVYKLDDPYLGQAIIYIYKSKTELLKQMNNNQSSGITVFENLPVGFYYVKAVGNEGGVHYEGDDSITISKDATENLQLALKPDGDLAVVVKQGSVAGNLIGGAQVQLFKSEADRTNGVEFKSSLTSITNPMDGAIFYRLPSQKYYVKVQYTNAQGTWTGLGESLVPRGMQTTIWVICTQ